MLQLHRPKQPNTTVNFKLDNSKNVYLSNPISTAPDWKAGCGSFGRSWARSSAQTLHCAMCSAQRPQDPRHPGIPWAWRGRGAEGFGARLHLLLLSACGKGRGSLCGPAKFQVLRTGVCSGSPEGRADLPRDISALQTLDMSISEAPSAQSCVHISTSAHCTSVTQDSRPKAKVTLFSLHLPEKQLTVCPEVGRAKAACSDMNNCCRQAGTDPVRPRQQDAEMPARRLHLLQQVKPSQLLNRTKKKKTAARAFQWAFNSSL